jgi:TonB family protein
MRIVLKATIIVLNLSISSASSAATQMDADERLRSASARTGLIAMPVVEAIEEKPRSRKPIDSSIDAKRSTKIEHVATSEESTQPKIVPNSLRPNYPIQSRQLGEEGEVLLRVLVSSQGSPAQVELLRSSGFPRLDEAAREAVAKWRFIPGRLGGVAVEAWIEVPVTFRKAPRLMGEKSQSASYADSIRRHIRSFIKFDVTLISGNPEVVFVVEQDLTGQIRRLEMAKSSGIAEWDSAIEQAIRASNPLPKVPNLGRVEPKIELSFRPHATQSTSTGECHSAYARKHWSVALDKCTAAANEGDAQSQFLLATIYESGKDTPRNLYIANIWYYEATLQGNVAATYRMGRLYLNEGSGLIESTSSISGDSADPERERRTLYTERERVKVGVGLIRKAAESDHPEAQRDLGYLYDQGKAVEKDPVEAIKWFRRAASNQDVVSQRVLGIMYRRGEGVPVNYEEAFKWLSASSRKGDVISQVVLAGMYGLGQGVPKDLARAHMWLSVSIQNDPVEQRRKESRELIERSMTQEEKNRAQEMFSECSKRSFLGCN